MTGRRLSAGWVDKSIEPTIDEVKELQRDKGIEDHVVWIGEGRFVMAHTDEERATIDLSQCKLHVWLMERDGPPDVATVPGYYVVREAPVDGYSTSYRGDGGRWEFQEMFV